ncbi:MAG: hypothetical protein JRG88_07345 [Deltaproteobacteria bacterium]|nr:hypothetical protein [Deltaproteobacteria bacterium]
MIDQAQLVGQRMISAATCCLVNPDMESTVERAFAVVNRMPHMLRDKYL